MHAHHALLHLAAAAAPLPLGACRMHTALNHGRLIDDADRLRIGMLTGHQLLATVTQTLFVPLDRFQEPL
jgi:hypothetical protein